MPSYAYLCRNKGNAITTGLTDAENTAAGALCLSLGGSLGRPVELAVDVDAGLTREELLVALRAMSDFITTTNGLP